MRSNRPSIVRASRQAFDAENCARRTRTLRNGLRRLVAANQRRRTLQERFFQAHADGMRAVAAHDSAALVGALVLENEVISDQAALIRDVRRVLASAYGIDGTRPRSARIDVPGPALPSIVRR